MVKLSQLVEEKFADEERFQVDFSGLVAGELPAGSGGDLAETE